MKLTFNYNKEKDIWCVMTYGKTSINSPTSTKVYEELIKNTGQNPTTEKSSQFIETYLENNNIDTGLYVSKYQKDWDNIAEEYKKRAEDIFKVSLPEDVRVYLSINNRCPYSIEDNLFFVQVPAYSMKKTAMHELWHFYTWYRFGITWEEKLGKQKYNEIKEALTVLLNVECKDFLPEGVEDKGYPQHQELREKILSLWSESKDMDMLWNKIVL